MLCTNFDFLRTWDISFINYKLVFFVAPFSPHPFLFVLLFGCVLGFFFVCVLFVGVLCLFVLGLVLWVFFCLVCVFVLG